MDQQSTASTTGAAATKMETTSQAREQVQAPCILPPLPDSIPRPPILSHSVSVPGPQPSGGTIVKAPLKSSVDPLHTHQGKAKYKKVTLNDNSWIKRKTSVPAAESAEIDSASTDEALANDSAEADSAVSNGPPATNALPLPYRSHSILPPPKLVTQPLFMRPASPSVSIKSDGSDGKPPRPELPPKLDVPSSPGQKLKKKGWGRGSAETKEKDPVEGGMSLHVALTTQHGDVCACIVWMQ